MTSKNDVTSGATRPCECEKCAQVPAAFEPQLPKKSVECLELDVRLYLEIKPICRQTRGDGSNLHQPCVAPFAMS
jgi:hypothetical protein